MAWTFFLYITNATDRELVTSSSDYDLKWGHWYRNSIDGQSPISVAAHQTVQCAGIRASKGTPTGYQFVSTWKDTTTPSPYGTVSIEIDVPFSSSNESNLHLTGLYTQEGWQPLPRSKSSFVRSFVLQNIDGNLAAVETRVTNKMKEEILENMATQMTEEVVHEMDQIDNDYNRLQSIIARSNEIVEDWDYLITSVPEISYSPSDFLPANPEYPPKKFLFGRSAPTEIEKSLWIGIGDRRFPTQYAKNQFISNYRSIAVYSINTNSRDWLSIPAGTTRKTVSTTEVTSSIKNTLETFYSIKASLGVEAGDPKAGAKIAANLESLFSHRDVMERSTTRINKKEISVDIPAAEYDRLLVPWVISKAVLIYRTTKSGKHGLVAVSEWADLQLTKLYQNSQ